jgi:hypothetical protein
VNPSDPKPRPESPPDAPAAAARPAYERPRVLRKRSVAEATLQSVLSSGGITPFDGGGPGGDGGPAVVGNG